MSQPALTYNFVYVSLAATAASWLQFEHCAHYLLLNEARRQLHADLRCRCFCAVWPGRWPWSPVLLPLRAYARDAADLRTRLLCLLWLVEVLLVLLLCHVRWQTVIEGELADSLGPTPCCTVRLWTQVVLAVRKVARVTLLTAAGVHELVT
jgi:hypothetical protein